jgi:hypothetical protein
MRDLLKANKEWKNVMWNRNIQDHCKICYKELGEEKKYTFFEGKCKTCFRIK